MTNYYEFTDYEPMELTQVEAFRALRKGDMIVIGDGPEWRVRSVRTIRSRGPHIGEVRLQDAHRSDPAPLAECIDYRAESSPQIKSGIPFRTKNAEGEWGYEDTESEMFSLVSTAERPENYRPSIGTQYFDVIHSDYFEVLEVGEYEVKIEYRDEYISIGRVPRLVFSLRREELEYNPVRT